MHVTLRQLRVFESVARHLSFSRAAEELFLSQPAVSMQIKQLESLVGLPLFEQIGKKIYLTEAGKEVFHYSRAVAQQLSDMEHALNELKGLERGRLSIAVVSTANFFAPQLLARFVQQHPGVQVSLSVVNRETVLRQLAENEIDLAIMGLPPEGLDVRWQPFMENPLVVIAPPSHPLVKEKRIPMKRLAEEVFVIREPGSGTRGAMERFFAEHRVQLKTSMQMGTNEAIKQAVQAGMGLGVVSYHTIELELETKRLKVLDVVGFPIRRNWYLVHREHKRLSKVAEAFREFLLKHAERLMQNKTPEKAPA
ncbi:LysR family transcriptional regulator [Pelomicrobium methylotrophicum]|uniref:LysR family transcriptional regulator n=1 Tax=Pelomicrobium methylotrophicum TaxID=2602750 RepID=A0A5C7EPV7_9PROT|nr:LysR family transcriptional regulator [Pelomicrobium methylotrophicum]